MTLPTPERVQQLATVLHKDRALLVTWEAEETAALDAITDAEGDVEAARQMLADAERKLAEAKEKAAAKGRERTALAADIEVFQAMLDFAAEKFGFQVPATAPPGWPPAPATPQQGMPVVRVAEPDPARPGYCTCGAILIREDGESWVHSRTGRPECPPAETVPDGDPTQRQELPGAVVAAALQGGAE